MSLVNSHLLYNHNVNQANRTLSKLQQQRQQELINKQREAAFNACVNGVFNEKSHNKVVSKHSSKSHKAKPQRRSTWTKIESNNSNAQLNHNTRQDSHKQNNVAHNSHNSIHPLTHSAQTAQYNELLVMHNNLTTKHTQRVTSANNNTQHKPRKKWTRQVSLPLFTDHHSDSDTYEDDFVEEQVLRPLSTNVSRQTTPNIAMNTDKMHNNGDDTVEVVEIEVDNPYSDNELEVTLDNIVT